MSDKHRSSGDQFPRLGRNHAGATPSVRHPHERRGGRRGSAGRSRIPLRPRRLSRMGNPARSAQLPTPGRMSGPWDSPWTVETGLRRPSAVSTGDPPGDRIEAPSAENACCWLEFTGAVAEGVGFEPTVDQTADNGFRDRPVQPLRHPSEALRGQPSESIGSAVGQPCPEVPRNRKPLLMFPRKRPGLR
jgi:hypothetical protein